MPTFIWLVHRGGIGWLSAPTRQVATKSVEAAAPESIATTVVESIEESEPRTVSDGAAYNALHNHSGLFISLASSDLTKDGIKDFLSGFAKREWGGRESRWPEPVKDNLWALGGLAMTTEQWVVQALEMRRLVDLWTLLRRREHGSLQTHIRWQESKDGLQVVYDPRETVKPNPQPNVAADQVEVIASRDVCPEWFAILKPNDVVLPAIVYLQSKVNKKLRNKVHLRLLYDTEEKALRQRPFTDDLITAVWLQFSQAIDSDKSFRQCKECAAHFEVSPEVARTNRRFCSNACRSRMYRQRQCRAREMHAARTPLEVIADRLDTDIDTVREWVKVDRPEQRPKPDSSPPEEEQ